MAESAGPARGYSWPPFEPGNEAAVRHGAKSPRKVDPLARELVETLLADPDLVYLRGGSYRPALWAYARAEAQVQLLTEYLAKAAEDAGDGVGDLDLDRVRAAYLLLHRAEARAMSGRSRLGLDPLSRARLRRDVVAAQADVAQIFAEMERVERERAQAGGEPS